MSARGQFGKKRQGHLLKTAALEPDVITTKNGLLYRNGAVVFLPEADRLAVEHGYWCAEQFIAALTRGAK